MFIRAKRDVWAELYLKDSIVSKDVLEGLDACHACGTNDHIKAWSFIPTEGAKDYKLECTKCGAVHTGYKWSDIKKEWNEKV